MTILPIEQCTTDMFTDNHGEIAKIEQIETINEAVENIHYLVHIRLIKRRMTTVLTLKSGNFLEICDVETKIARYLYSKKDMSYFQLEKGLIIEYPSWKLGHAQHFLSTNLEFGVSSYDGSVVHIHAPKSVDLTVTTVHGIVTTSSVTGVIKHVLLNNGYDVFVPAYIQVGDVITIDTKSGEFLQRSINKSV